MKALLKKLLRIPLLLLGLASSLTLLVALAYWLSDRTNASLVSSGVKRRSPTRISVSCPRTRKRESARGGSSRVDRIKCSDRGARSMRSWTAR